MLLSNDNNIWDFAFHGKSRWRNRYRDIYDRWWMVDISRTHPQPSDPNRSPDATLEGTRNCNNSLLSKKGLNHCVFISKCMELERWKTIPHCKMALILSYSSILMPALFGTTKIMQHKLHARKINAGLFIIAMAGPDSFTE